MKFNKIYKTTVILFLVVVAIAAIFFLNWLGKYEVRQPSHIATVTFEQYFSTYDKLSKYIDSATDGVDENTIIEYKTYLKGLYDEGPASFYNAISDSKDSFKYFVIAGNNIKFASFILQPDGDSYLATNFEILLDGETAVTGDTKVVIEAPSTYTVTVNGTEIGKDYIKVDKIEGAYQNYCENVPDDLADICTYVRYEVPSNETPEIKIVDKDGNEAKVENKDGKYIASVIYDESLKEEWNDYLIGAMEKYAQYMQYDESSSVVGFGQIAQYFDPTSDLYEDIRTVENGFVTYYDGVHFEDEDTSEYVVYNGLTFSCRVQLTQVLEKNGWENTNDFMDLTLYLHKIGDDYLIYYMKQN